MTPPSTASAPDKAPSVLVVLVVRDAAAWLRETLSALAAQTYPRLAVLAVDNASTDGSSRAPHPGAGGAARHHLARRLRDRGRVDGGSRPSRRERGRLRPGRPRRCRVRSGYGDSGSSRPPRSPASIASGIVGAKVVDWDDPRELRDVGRSADRFGHPYSPLQPGEIDQGQFDRVLEVLFVSSCAMLVSRDAWQRAGLLRRAHRPPSTRPSTSAGARASPGSAC